MSVTESKLIQKPKPLLLDGKDPTSQSIEVSLWIESLQTWAAAQQHEPLLYGGYEEYLKRYPLILSKAEPRKPDLTRMYKDLEKNTLTPLYSEAEKMKKELEFEEKKHEYEHVKRVEEAKFREKVEQKASLLWGMMTNCLNGDGSIDIIRETNRVIESNACSDKPSFALALLKRRKIKLDVTLLPELHRRYCLLMPANMDPELFISEKKVLLNMLRKLNYSTSEKEGDFITSILSQLPMEHYLKVYEELVAVSRRNGMTGNVLRFAGDMSGQQKSTYTGGSTTTVKKELTEEEKEQLELEDQIAGLEKTETDPAVIAVLRSFLKKRSPIVKINIEEYGLEPLDLDKVQHALKTRFNALVKAKIIKPSSIKENNTYFVSVPGVLNTSSDKEKTPAAKRDVKPNRNESKKSNGGSGGNGGNDGSNNGGRRSSNKFRGKKYEGGKNNGGEDKPRYPCYLCDSLDHLIVDCPLKSQLKDLQKSNGGSGTTTGGASKDNKSANGNDSKPQGAAKKLVRKGVGFGGHIGGISFHVSDLSKFDSTLFLDDNGSNTDIVNDEDLLVDVQPLDAYVNGVGSAKVTGIGVFVGKSINRDGSEVPIARKRVLVCPSFSRNIIGTSVLQRRDDVVFNRQCTDPHMLTIMGDDEDDVLQYDLHDNPADSSDPFLYFQFVPLDDDEISEEHEEFIASAVEANRKEIRGLQAQVYHAELKKAKKEVLQKCKTTPKKRTKYSEPLSSKAEMEEIDRTAKKVSHAHTRKGAAAPIMRRVTSADRSEDSPLSKMKATSSAEVNEVAVKASINDETDVGEIVGDGASNSESGSETGDQ